MIDFFSVWDVIPYDITIVRKIKIDASIQCTGVRGCLHLYDVYVESTVVRNV